ncbi:transposase, partial [Patescibacteria group bacterium]
MSSRLSPERKIKVIKQVLNRGVSVSEACRRHGISRPTYYRWLEKYQQSSPDQKFTSLSSQVAQGDRHWRRLKANQETKVLEAVAKNPTFSVHQLDQAIPSIGHHGIQSILERYQLSLNSQRLLFAQRYKKKFESSIDHKLRVIGDYEAGESVSRVCLKHNISRQTFYRWHRLYQKDPSQAYSTLASKRPKGETHWKTVDQQTSANILSLVTKHPEYSTHKIARQIRAVGNHGVQNVLKRLNLNTFEKRLAYSQAQLPTSAPVFGLAGRLRKLIGSIPSISAIPPPTSPPTSLKLRGMNWLRGAGPALLGLLTPIIKLLSGQYGPLGPFAKQALSPLLRPFIASLLVSLLFSNFSAYWLNMIANTPTLGGKVGMFFASMALLIGGFFFIYSMKYYFTLAIVLSFSRQSEEEGGGFIANLNGRLNGSPGTTPGVSDSTPGVNARKGLVAWVARIFGINADIADGKLMNTDYQRGSAHYQRRSVDAKSKGGLLPSLDHITLKRKPFVSIQLPFYNEKKVAERIMRACASMDYYQDGKAQFEVIVCDDSTDETVDIVQSFSKKWNDKNPHGPRIKVLHRPTREGFK